MKLSIGQIGTYFAQCAAKKRQERINNLIGIATESLETRDMMSANPVAALVAQESASDDPELAMYADLVHNYRVQGSGDAGNSVASQSYEVSAVTRKKKDPKPKPDKSGFQLLVANTTDGHINANATESMQRLDMTTNKKPITAKAITGTLRGDIEDVVSVQAVYNGTTIAVAQPNPVTGAVNLGTFNVGILKRGSASIEIFVTMGPNAHGTVSWTTDLMSARHPRNSLPLLLPPHNSVTATATVGNGNNGGGTGGNADYSVSGPITVQEGGTATFAINLNQAATSSVVFDLMPQDPTAVGVQSSVTFAPGETTKTVSVSGLTDADQINDMTSILVSVNDAGSPNEWDVLGDKSVGVTVIDTTTGGGGGDVHLITTETGGGTQVNETGVGNADTILYRLSAQPSGNVTVNVMSTDTSSGTVAPQTLTFTPSNWNVDQSVTVIGVPDADQQIDMFNVQATSSVGNSTVGVTVIDVTPNEVSWDAVQVYFVNPVKLISISGFNAVFANEEMQLLADLDGDGNASNIIGPIVVADTNGGFITQPNPQAYQLNAGTIVQVRFWDPASQGFRNANGIAVHYLDAAGTRHEVGVNSPEVTMQGPALIIR